MSPRRKKPPVPPGLAEDPARLEAEAASGPAPGQEEIRPGRSGSTGGKQARARKAAPQEPALELPFPVEAIALLHLELWNVLAKRLRSKYELSAQGAQEMANYADLCIRQYLGPYLANHAALAGYMMTQAAAVLALLALRETPKPPRGPGDQALPRPAEPLYSRPVTDAELHPPARAAA